MTDIGFKRQFPSNLISNIIYFLMNIIIGVWIVPFYILKLNVHAYGFIQLATQITFFATFITLSLNSAVARFLTIHIQNNDKDEANKTFNTALFVSVIIVLFLLPLSIILSFYADKIFTIPPDVVNVTETKLLFLIVFLSFLVTFLSNPFSASTVSNNRLDLSNLINIINVGIRTGLIILLLNIFQPSLISVGISFFVASVFSFLTSYIICKKISPELSIKFSYFDKSKIKNLTQMSIWLVINQLGTIFLVNFDLILINFLFKDTALQGKYAVLLQMSVLLRNLSFIISRVTGPMIYISYAKNEITKMVSIMKSSVKFMGIALALPIGIMCGMAKPFLNVWLGPQSNIYIELIGLFWLMTAPLIINLGIQPLYSISNAYNKVKIPGIVTLITGLFYIFLVYILAKNTNLGLYAIALSGMIILTLKNGIFTTLYSAHIVKINKLTFIKPVIGGLILMLLVFFIAYLVSHLTVINSWFALLSWSALICIFAFPIIWFFLINKNEKDILMSIIEKIFVK